MPSFRLGNGEINLDVIGAGLRNGVLPPPRTHRTWDLSPDGMRALEAFHAAGWRFHPEPELDWDQAKELNGGDIEAGLLARHSRGDLVILTNHLLARLPSKDVVPAEIGEAEPVPLRSDLYDVRLRVPAVNLLGRIRQMLVVFNTNFAFDGDLVAEPSLLYHVVHPGEVFRVALDPRNQLHWERVKLERAWTMAETYGKRPDGTPTRVAVIDLGFHLREPQLAVQSANTAFVNDKGEVGFARADGRYLDRAGNEIVPRMPEEWHGTLCAGLVGARLDMHSVNGAAPECELMLVALQSVTSAVALGNAIRVCVTGIDGGDGADVIVSSAGRRDAAWDYPTDLKKEVEFALARGRGGMLGTPIVWASFNVDKVIPADSLEAAVICVSQHDEMGARTSSGFGTALDLMAPGTGVTVIDPGGTTGSASGSSCAAPMVAGVAALVLSVNPGLTEAQVFEILTQSCDPEAMPKRHDDEIGFGRLNARRAIDRTPRPSQQP